MKGLCPDCGVRMKKVSVVRGWGERGKEDIQKNLWFCEKCDVIWNKEKRDPDTFRGQGNGREVLLT